jgi:hypothetical protein
MALAPSCADAVSRALLARWGIIALIPLALVILGTVELGSPVARRPAV